jgi:hypothetical protein
MVRQFILCYGVFWLQNRWVILTQAIMEVLLYFCIGIAVNAADLVPTVVFAVTLLLTAVDTMRVLQAPFWELKLIFLNAVSN